MGILDTAYINRERVKKQVEPLPLRNTSYIEKISKVLFKEYGFTDGVGALLISRGVKRWRLYAINNLDINNNYERIVSLVDNMLNYAPISCSDEVEINQYTGQSHTTRICSEGKDLYQRLQIINSTGADDDTDRWREQWEVAQSLGNTSMINNDYEDEIVKQIENAKNRYK